jgi:hypothetical protein
VSIDAYLAALDAKLHEIEGLIAVASVEREIDANLGIGYIKGVITFIDGSKLEFSEQMPERRQKFRIHHMDAQGKLIIRWDSAPHHRELKTFPFHVHTPQGVQDHEAVTLLTVLGEVVKKLLVVS